MSTLPAKPPSLRASVAQGDDDAYIPVGLSGILAASEKLKAVSRGHVEPDDRDSLEFKTYLTPPCAKALTWEHADFGTEVLEPTTMADIKVRQQSGEELKPDEVCKNKGAGFYQTRALLPGLLGIGRDRWTPNGDWNW